MMLLTPTTKLNKDAFELLFQLNCNFQNVNGERLSGVNEEAEDNTARRNRRWNGFITYT